MTTYTLNCGVCGEPYKSNVPYPVNQQCPKCELPRIDQPYKPKPISIGLREKIDPNFEEVKKILACASQSEVGEYSTGIRACLSIDQVNKMAKEICQRFEPQSKVDPNFERPIILVTKMSGVPIPEPLSVPEKRLSVTSFVKIARNRAKIARLFMGVDKVLLTVNKVPRYDLTEHKEVKFG